MTELHIQFSTSTAFTSGIIRRLTHSPFSHVDIILPNDGSTPLPTGSLAARKMLLGVSGKDDSIHDEGGVQIRPPGMWPYLTRPKVARLQCTDLVANAVIDAARSQLGKPFDNGALWCMLEDQAHEALMGKVRDWRDTSQWFCSEHFIWSCEQGGLFPYPLVVTKNRVTPADALLLINPFMSAENIAEFLAPAVAA